MRGASPVSIAVSFQPGNRDDRRSGQRVSVIKHLHELMRVPTIKAGAVMPDACPAGSAPGTIPVGGIVACENAIHPGYHSADICCSMAISIFDRDTDPLDVLDAGTKLTHFGPGGRPMTCMRPSDG
jgi:tRNA-splicing ligase RtcB